MEKKSVGEDVEYTEPLYTVAGNVNWWQSLQKNSMEFHQKAKIRMTV